jgi:membrane protein
VPFDKGLRQAQSLLRMSGFGRKHRETMQEISPESPEERARWHRRHLDQLRPGGKAFEVTKRIAIGVYSDGFIHAGNIAYLALLTLFPFFIVLAALAQLLGREPDTLMAVDTFLQTLPPSVASLLATPIRDVLVARTGSLLWLGAAVGLWTVGSFIETIRDILRRAYGTRYSRPFWEYRLTAIALIIGSVILALTAFSVQIALTAAEQFVYRLLPFTGALSTWLGLSRLAPLLMLWGALYMLFYALTPSKYRYSGCPKWPGALFTACWWIGATMLLPIILGMLGDYGLTYGSLAGVIVALIFFWIVGLGLVIGAHLNAALAEYPEAEVRDDPEPA